jgi:CheY-like chemotaxis protein
MVKSLSLLLEAAGYETKGVYSAQSILTDVSEFDPDVIIMDIAMPGPSGWEAASNVRAKSGNRRRVLIAVTGQHARGTGADAAHTSGFDHVLMKPIDPSKLLGLISGYL